MIGESPTVRFVVAPFLPEHQPALGVSSLQAVLRARGIASDIVYLNIDYVGIIGQPLYYLLSRGAPTEYLLGEMIFARALWGDRVSWNDYRDRFRRSFSTFARQVPLGFNEAEALTHETDRWNSTFEQLRDLHYDAPRLIQKWARALAEDATRLVGFTSTFQQNLASLALAKALRAIAPREALHIMFGGANCEDDMGRVMAHSFPFVDTVVSGEGEALIADLVESVIDRHVPGQPAQFMAAATVNDLDALPIPNFDEYFAAIKGTGEEPRANLVAESSRGCWWGMKSHCTFCGLNGTTMAYRSKTPTRFAAEVTSLARRHSNGCFHMADNIMDMAYVQALFPELAFEDVSLFYETKSNLKKEQLELMAAGGVDTIQPGIESLSTAILTLMGKGTSRLQNIQLLKWCEEFGVVVKWNLLYGFPGENPEEYDAMASLMTRLVHLPPPSGCARVRLDRFGPYWRAPEKHGLRNVRPFWSYGFAYPGLTDAQRERLAYFFEYDYADERMPSVYAKSSIDAANEWVLAYRAKTSLELRSEDGDRQYVIVDRRGLGADESVAVTARERRLLKVLDSARSARGALEAVNATGSAGAPFTPDEYDAMVAYFDERRWTVTDAGRILSVVLDRSERERVIARRVALQLAGLGVLSFGDPSPSVNSPAIEGRTMLDHEQSVTH